MKRNSLVCAVLFACSSTGLLLSGCGNVAAQKKPGREDKWSEVTVKLYYMWAKEYGDVPKPQIAYFCPEEWVFSGAYSYETGKPIEGMTPKCIQPKAKP